MSDNHHGFPDAEALRARIMAGFALCSEAASQLRAESRAQAGQTIGLVKRIIAEADVIVGGAFLPRSTSIKLGELLSELKRLLEKVERSEESAST